MYRIFIIEDDSKISAVLKRNIVKYGYEAASATQFRDIMPELAAYEPHLIMLDINLPYFDGYYWCRQIRMKSNVPIIFISARAGEMDQVMAIENGGDDYITKPIQLDLFNAKMKGVLRRVYGDYSAPTGLAASLENELHVHGLRLNLSRNELIYHTHRIQISKNEQLLAECFLQQYGRTVSREQLLGTLWDHAQFVDDNTLTVNVARLRKRLEELGLPDAITTVRGLGYKLHLDEVQEETDL
ncbi:DNA-binding response OmpR family regulator [Fontibacillus phaseoli]|uniref:DNA-binding response OmpR family regulator n=1 Tax=Fontibacillus phaseoli TaxID=1416533 RepID=A0A369BQ02_9BACL|nr:response regulator transcription factor [Fontibacillus phaseoli]RCX23709.1 DNA-binding response OmpR family regulator [Fontibacillus phaseoli]